MVEDFILKWLENLENRISLLEQNTVRQRGISRKLISHGNSLVVTIPPAIIESLKLKKGMEVLVPFHLFVPK